MDTSIHSRALFMWKGWNPLACSRENTSMAKTSVADPIEGIELDRPGRQGMKCFRIQQGPSKTPKLGGNPGIGQIWINGLDYVKFDFRQGGSNFRVLRGLRTEIRSI